ncbi:hypothetical protein OG568_01165 [Streptomyces sp. NBC_01450]|uniref:hypothetical protein n=1 Tax=Streptomyces sp. NBC_01450 TaxID=2903871 RepID=UPI002E315632|nr:hypothetical protein [Streptomyces sp. NBC_01450]
MTAVSSAHRGQDAARTARPAVPLARDRMRTTPTRIVSLSAAGTCYAVELTEPAPRPTMVTWPAPAPLPVRP